MPAYKESFEGRTGVVGTTEDGWTKAAGELRILTEGQAEFVFGGQALYDGWDANNYAEPTGGVGWENDTNFPHAAWDGARAVGDDYFSYAIEDATSTYEEARALTRTGRSDVRVACSGSIGGVTRGMKAEWEVDGVRYGRKGPSAASQYELTLLGSDIYVDNGYEEGGEPSPATGWYVFPGIPHAGSWGGHTAPHKTGLTTVDGQGQTVPQWSVSWYRPSTNVAPANGVYAMTGQFYYTKYSESTGQLYVGSSTSPARSSQTNPYTWSIYQDPDWNIVGFKAQARDTSTSPYYDTLQWGRTNVHDSTPVPDTTPVAGERYVCVLHPDTNATIDRFRFPFQVNDEFESSDWFGGSGFAAIARRFKRNPNGTWHAKATLKCEGAQWDNWGDAVIVLAADTPDGTGLCSIELNVDVAGWIGVRYTHVEGEVVSSVLQRAANSNGVEPAFPEGEGYPGTWPDVPDQYPEKAYTYELVVFPDTGVCQVWINGVLIGSCTIPADQMARIRASYDAGLARWVGVGIQPFIFGEVRDTWYLQEFSTWGAWGPGSIGPGGADGTFVAPTF